MSILQQSNETMDDHVIQNGRSLLFNF